MLQSGDIISGMYQVIREIGTGGMGVIYIGYHLHLQKQIVIKKICLISLDHTLMVEQYWIYLLVVVV